MTQEAFMPPGQTDRPLRQSTASTSSAESTDKKQGEGRFRAAFSRLGGFHMQDCFLRNGADRMNGEFPVLKPGANAVSRTGTVIKVAVRPNWRYL